MTAGGYDGLVLLAFFLLGFVVLSQRDRYFEMVED